MGKLRLVYDNAADRAAISASSSSGLLVPANLRTELKAEIWRGQTTTEKITLQWATQESLSMVAFPFCNLSSNARMRIIGYAHTGDAGVAMDTGEFLCSQYAPFDLWEWGVEPLGVNAFAYGGGSYAVGWFDPIALQRIEIILTDPGNPDGYIEASRCVAGIHWSPRYNGTYGVNWKIINSERPERSEAGDRRVEIGNRHRWVSVDLAYLTPEDRSRVMSMIRGGGAARPFFLSVFPQKVDDPQGEQSYHLWCALAGNDPSVLHPSYMAFRHQLEVEEM